MTETAASTRVPVSIQLIGDPTALLEIGGLRLLTDPAFDAHDQRGDNLDRSGRALRAAFAGYERLGVVAARGRITL
jgi:hypothetical protein